MGRRLGFFTVLLVSLGAGACTGTGDDEASLTPAASPAGGPTQAATNTPTLAPGSPPQASATPRASAFPPTATPSAPPTSPSGLETPSPLPALVTPTPVTPSTSSPTPVTPTPAVPTPVPVTPTPPGPTPGSPPLLVLTTDGPVLGFEDEMSTVAWLGVPFAAPPVDALRWRAPVPPASWTDPLDASTLPPACPQFEERDEDGDGESEVYPVGQEDCLYLNVWRPATDQDDPLPVMVWIHGGGNVQGSTSMPLYDGARLAARADVLLVTVQYRLNLFGFLYHEALFDGDPVNDSGNFAMLDLLRALEWVRDNAGAFGGDPSRVTIFGESAGGTNTWSMLMSPLAAGLFHRAIVESGCYSSRTLEEARDHAEEIVETLVVADGLTTADEAGAWLEAQGTPWITDYLYGKTLDDIMGVFAQAGGFPLSAFKPARDGVVFSDGAEADLIDGNFHHVPLIVGANRDEEKLFYYDLAGMNEVEYQAYMRLLFGDDVDAVEALYPREAYDPATPYNQFTDILDLMFEPICSEYLSWLVSPYQPTWLYHFRYDNLTAPYDYIFGAAHSFELPFIFDKLDSELYAEGYEMERQQLRDVMTGYWGCMAWTGSPNCDDAPVALPEWAPVGQAGRESFRRIVLDDVVVPEALPDINLERINFWLSYYDLPYPPVPMGPD